MSGSPRSPRRTTTRTLAAAALCVAAVLPTAAPGTTAPAAVAAAGITATQPVPVGVNANEQLLRLAARIRPTAADLRPGADSCVHVQRRLDDSDSTIVFESIRHITPAGAGAIWQRRATVPAGADPAAVNRQLHQSAATVTTYGPGELVSTVGDPVSTDAAVLAARVDDRAAGLGAAAHAAVLTDVATIRYLDVAQRAAVLRVLATLPGLTGGGVQTDPAGRTGSVFQVGDGTGRIIVTVDPDSGRLLSSEVMAGSGPRHRTLLLSSTRCGCSPAAALSSARAVVRPSAGRTGPLATAWCRARTGAPVIMAIDGDAAGRR